MKALDFEKAFDRVEHRSLVRAFQFFGFPNFIIKWLEILFTDMELCTINNGITSRYFHPSRGIYQGNPISPYGFLVLIELLAIDLRKNPDIKGIKIGNYTHLLSMFADDVNMFMQFKQSSWQAALNTLDQFTENTGLKINYDKTTVYRLGSVANSNACFYSSRKLKWSDKPLNSLGIFIAHQAQTLLDMNYKDIIERTRTILEAWHNCSLSLLGKILVFNTLVSFLFVYKMSVLPTFPENYVKLLNKLVRDFLWDKGVPKVAPNILTG